jgi:hypothetical protein
VLYRERIEKCFLLAVYGRAEENEISPPSSARDCSRTDLVTLSAKESMATSAATPREIADM